MGHRANYIIVHNKTLQIFFSNWGAQTIVADIFWGPNVAENFIVKNVPDTKLLTEMWAEGGVILDHDMQTVVWYSDFDEDVHPVAQQFVKYLWQKAGWHVQHVRRFDKLAEYLGVDKNNVKDPLEIPKPIKLNEPEISTNFFTLISVFENKSWQHFATTHNAPGILMNGPSSMHFINSFRPLTQQINRIHQLTDALSNGRKYLENSIAINLADKKIVAGGINFYRVHPESISHEWPSWQLIIHDDFSDFREKHFAFVGEKLPDLFEVDPSLNVTLPLDDQIEKLRELIFSVNDVKDKTSEFISKIAKKGMTFVSGADKLAYGETPDLLTQQQLFAEAEQFVRYSNKENGV